MTAVVEPTPDQLPDGWSDGARAYDRWFAPLTGQYAGDVVDALRLGPGDRFLDVAAGTGVLTRAAAAAGASVLATDFAPGMVEQLRESTADLDVTVERMDGQSLDLPDGGFDAAGSLFGLIFFPDLAAGARELRRAVRVGGRIAVGAWDEAGFPLSRLVARSLRRVLPELVPGPNVSMRLGREEPLAALLRDAGCRDVEVRSVTHHWHLGDPAAFFRAVPSWSQPLRPLIAQLDAEQLERAAVACGEVLDELSDGTGTLPFTALIGVGVH